MPLHKHTVRDGHIHRRIVWTGAARLPALDRHIVVAGVDSHVVDHNVLRAERVNAVRVVPLRQWCQHLHVAEGQVFRVVRHNLPHGRVLHRDILHQHMLHVVKDDQPWPGVAFRPVRPPALAAPVNDAPAADGDVLHAVRAQQALPALLVKLLNLGIVVVVGAALERRPGGDLQSDVALQHQRRAHKLRRSGQPHHAATLRRAVVNGLLDGHRIQRLAVTGRAILLHSAHRLRSRCHAPQHRQHHSPHL